MHIPRFWISANSEADGMDLKAWGWSDTDPDEARQRAAERLERMLARIAAGEELPRGYGYGTRPMREEIVMEVPGADGQTAAIITRNSYGCLVLNTARIMFIDIDHAARSEGVGAKLARLFGRKKAAPDPQEETLEKVKAALSGTALRGYRIYRTAAGLRILATDGLYEPGSEASESIMAAVEADPHFVHLCRVQKSFRARLTPKPWRCGVRPPQSQYPRAAKELPKFERWLKEYQKRIEGKATCRLVEDVGSEPAHGEVSLILNLHDESTKAKEDCALA